ncbi:DUF1799 domain-containing protein [Polaromonas sp.]|uniref:DUF1799 domain-containing protein n=1 Tax=Polaromonas sp. TaxID=1869339 RepID=UPI0035633BCA
MDESNTLAALEAFGATPQQLEQARDVFRQKGSDKGFGIWPENWRAFELFEACATQWTLLVSPTGRVQRAGIDYTRFDSIERRMPLLPGQCVPEPRELFRQLRVCEQTAMQHLNEG